MNTKTQPILWLVMLFTGICLVSCKSHHLDDLSQRLSESGSFIEWNHILDSVAKAMKISDSKNRLTIERYKKAGFQTIVDTYIKSVHSGKDFLLNDTIVAQTTKQDTLWKQIWVLNNKIVKEFPELKQLSKRDQATIFNNALKLMRKKGTYKPIP